MSKLKMIKKTLAVMLVLAQAAAVGTIIPSTVVSAATPRQMETLDRGVVAVKTDEGVFVSWRRQATEPADTVFTLYRNNTVVTEGAVTNFVDPQGTIDDVYTVVANGNMSDITPVLENNYIEIPLADTPKSDLLLTDRNGVYYGSYAPGDSVCGDVDGDGEYEIIMMWNPADAKDAASVGSTGKVYIDCYELDGTFLWRIDMGHNIRAGAHDTMLCCADFNSDGKAELVVRTADGTTDAAGTVIGDPDARWDLLNGGKNLQGPLFLTAFEGATGKIIHTTEYDPQTEDMGYSWGDNFGNRSERYIATIAWLDGIKPSVVVQRGYYGGKDVGPGRTVVAAYSMENNKLVKQWRFDTTDEGNSIYIGQGNHNLTAGDADGDGKDEIFSGSLAHDDDGSVLWCTFYGHGDAQHLGDFDPNRPGLEYAKCYEEGNVHPGFNGAPDQVWGTTLQNAATGEVYLSHNGVKDTGRCLIGNIGYKDSAFVIWGAGSSGYWTDKDAPATEVSNAGLSMSDAIYWDGDLQRELKDHVNVTKWNDNTNSVDLIFSAEGCYSINGTKGNTNMQGDILGDWREEIVVYTIIDESVEEIPMKMEGRFDTVNHTWTNTVDVVATRAEYKYALRVYTTTDPTDYNFYTLTHDPIYRISFNNYNICYNQPTQVGFYISDKLGYTTQPEANITLVKNSTPVVAFDASKLPADGEKAPEDPNLIKVKLDGKTLKFDQNPVIINDRTMVPLRGIFEALGATVNWDDATKTVTANKGSRFFEMTLGNVDYKVDDEVKTSDVAPQIVSDRTMVPARVIAESFNCEVGWDGDTRTVTIKTTADSYFTVSNYEGAKVPDYASVTGAELKEAKESGSTVIAIYAMEAAQLAKYTKYLTVNGWTESGEQSGFVWYELDGTKVGIADKTTDVYVAYSK